jgi:hypothetical protein
MRDPDIKADIRSAEPLSQDDQRNTPMGETASDDLAIADLIFEFVAAALEL